MTRVEAPQLVELQDERSRTLASEFIQAAGQTPEGIQQLEEMRLIRRFPTEPPPAPKPFVGTKEPVDITGGQAEAAGVSPALQEAITLFTQLARRLPYTAEESADFGVSNEMQTIEDIVLTVSDPRGQRELIYDLATILKEAFQ